MRSDYYKAIDAHYQGKFPRADIIGHLQLQFHLSAGDAEYLYEEFIRRERHRRRVLLARLALITPGSLIGIWLVYPLDVFVAALVLASAAGAFAMGWFLFVPFVMVPMIRSSKSQGLSRSNVTEAVAVELLVMSSVFVHATLAIGLLFFG